MNRIEQLKQRIAELDRRMEVLKRPPDSWAHQLAKDERRELNSELTRLETEAYNKETR
jgi:hypothetical protein